jgi:hypothetical protein
MAFKLTLSFKVWLTCFSFLFYHKVHYTGLYDEAMQPRSNKANKLRTLINFLTVLRVHKVSWSWHVILNGIALSVLSYYTAMSERNSLKRRCFYTPTNDYGIESYCSQYVFLLLSNIPKLHTSRILLSYWLLNLLDISSKFRNVATFVIINEQIVCHIQFVAMFVNSRHTKFHIRSSKDSLVVCVKPKAKWTVFI